MIRRHKDGSTCAPDAGTFCQRAHLMEFRDRHTDCVSHVAENCVWLRDGRKIVVKRPGVVGKVWL